MRAVRAFWLDEQVDREHATDGRSRYDAEACRRIDEFRDAWGDIAPVTFAVAAWRLAAGLTPGFVRWHQRIVAADCRRSPWDGGLVCAVSLVAPWPADLARSLDWQRGRCWRDWPTEFRGDGYDFVDPTEKDVTEYPFMQASLALTFPVAVDRLPAAPEGPDDGVEDRARQAVEGLVTELNHTVGPVLDVLEGGRSR